MRALSEFSVPLLPNTQLLGRGLRSELARVTIARKIAAITLAVWKKGEAFDADKLIKHAA